MLEDLAQGMTLLEVVKAYPEQVAEAIANIHKLSEHIKMDGDIRIFRSQVERVETGPIQFGNDWPGVFIRGDEAAGLSLTLSAMLEMIPKEQAILILQISSLINLLNSSNLTMIEEEKKELAGWEKLSEEALKEDWDSPEDKIWDEDINIK
jgi:hypothetical protein